MRKPKYVSKADSQNIRETDSSIKTNTPLSINLRGPKGFPRKRKNLDHPKHNLLLGVQHDKENGDTLTFARKFTHTLGLIRSSGHEMQQNTFSTNNSLSTRFGETTGIFLQAGGVRTHRNSALFQSKIGHNKRTPATVKKTQGVSPGEQLWGPLYTEAHTGH